MATCNIVLRRSILPGNPGAARLLGATAMLALVLASASPRAHADEELPGRVGRIAEFAGQLYQSPEDRAAEWTLIGLNYPIASGDNLWVTGDGRAEIDYGGGQFRLAGETSLHVSRMDETQLSLFLAQGRVIVRLRVLDPGDAARIDTPNTQVQMTRTGLYRIEVTPDRQTTAVTIREGEATTALVAGVQQALPGQTVIVTGPDPLMADVRNATGQDGFDTWSADRDRRYERSRASAHVSRQMVGYADLDEYGTWQVTPEYGTVWYPTMVADGWAPYGDGYWTTVGGWGNTWVDNAPWGYAPFHYGRWAYVGGRWGWCPGAYALRPAWAPALVGWYGGTGWGTSIGYHGPVYGWVPLAWGEPYHPSWRGCSANCWARCNRPYAVDMAVRSNALAPRNANIGNPGAMTALAGNALIGRRPVGENLLRIPGPQAALAPVLAAAPIVGSGPRHVPIVRTGDGGVPAPASTFYPASRSARTGGSVPLRQALPSASGESGTTAGSAPGGAPLPTRVAPAPAAPRPPNSVALPSPNAAAGPRPSPPTGKVAGVLAPGPETATGGNAASGSAASIEARARRKIQPVPPSGVPVQPATAAQVTGGIPIPPSSATRAAPLRQTQSEGGFPLPPPSPRGASDARSVGLHAPVAAPVAVPGTPGAAPRANGPAAPPPAVAPAGGQGTVKPAAVTTAAPANNNGGAVAVK
jgi:hypothetical protein